MRVLLPLIFSALLGASCMPSSGPRAQAQDHVSLPALGAEPATSDQKSLQERGEAVDDLSWLTGSRQASAGAAATPEQRSTIIEEKQRLLEGGDIEGVARLNAVQAGEAFARASRVVDRWLNRRDPATGLLPTSIEPEGQAWMPGDTGADLYGHLTIGTWLLAPGRYDEMLGVLAAERRIAPDLPDDIGIPDGRPRGLSLEERIFAASEYAKDGLMPLVEEVGPDPWLGRVVELADEISAASAIPTPYGLIPSYAAEVNGNMLQFLPRLGRATGEPRFRVLADRIALAYLGALPTTRYLPPHRWDFMANEPLDRRRFRLSDHGNEILSGLLEWHLDATLRGEPSAPQHREAIRKMLDRLLEKGRTPDGLWHRVLEIPSGKVDGEGLTDNWGYLLQAYLTAALVEDIAPEGEAERAARYRDAARQALLALPRYRYYAWQQGVMDGYADSIESALYLLNEIRVPEADAWVDDQIGVLYGFQAADGSVLERDLDGNFIRTTLLYGLARAQGVRPAPWQEGLLVGAAADGACIRISATSPSNWSGRLVFDAPRHMLHLKLPVDYPRLNEWPEWFTARAGTSYTVNDAAGQLAPLQDGAALIEGLAVQLRAGQEQRLRVCPATAGGA